MEYDNLQIIELKTNILEANDMTADRLRESLKKEKTFLLNLMASPGAGKTSILLKTIDMLKNDMKIGIMEADIDSDVDAKKIADAGGRAIQLHTGGMCHLDAEMTSQGLAAFKTEDLDLVVLENVGNLVCPAEFDTGAHKNAMILSVPEGDDKPLKYPLMFEVCDVVLVNKIDAMSCFDFDLDRFTMFVHQRHPGMEVIPVSAKTGEGLEQWCSWLKTNVNRFTLEVEHEQNQ